MIRINEAQKNMLIEFVRDNASILFGFGSTFGTQTKSLLWEEITSKLNDLSTSKQSRTTSQWKRAWLDLKKNTKKKLNKIKQVRDVSGSLELTPHETIIATVCGMDILDDGGDIEEFGGENRPFEEVKMEVDDSSQSSEFLYITPDDQYLPLPQTLTMQNTLSHSVSDTNSIPSPLLPTLSTASPQLLPQPSSSRRQLLPQPVSFRIQTSPQPVSFRPQRSPQPVSCRPQTTPQPVSCRPQTTPQPVSFRPQRSPQTVSCRPQISPQTVSCRPQRSPQTVSCRPQTTQPVSCRPQTTPRPVFCRPQTSPQPGSSKSQLTSSAIRSRRHRERISEILGPYDKRHKETKRRSESVAVSSVFRQLEMQEETVGLLKQAVSLLTDVKDLLGQVVSNKIVNDKNN